MSIVQRKIWLQSLADRTAKPFWSRNPWLEWFSLKKKKEKEKTTKKSHCEGQRRDEVLTVSCYIALRSPESAAKTAVLMENMTDAFFSNSVPLVSVTFNWRTAGILAPPTGTPKCFNVCTFYVNYNKWEQCGNFFINLFGHKMNSCKYKTA